MRPPSTGYEYTWMIVGLAIVFMLGILISVYGYYYYIDATALFIFAFIVIILSIPFWFHDSMIDAQPDPVRDKSRNIHCPSYKRSIVSIQPPMSNPFQYKANPYYQTGTGRGPVFIPTSYVEPVNRYVYSNV